jgi:predicted P-loop ATPase/GTPase
MGAQIVGMLDEAGRMFKSRVEMEYDSALLKKQQQLLDDYDEWTQKRREQLVDEMMRARENIINQVVVESLNEEPNGSYVKIYLRDDGEQSE